MTTTGKDDLLRRLAELNITQRTIEHQPVMTSAEQLQVPELEAFSAGMVKNLFLKDRKGRLYLISKLESTKCDLKVLAKRLGLPKDSLRMAAAELMQEVLGVPLGSATPLAAANPAAGQVVLLLDELMKLQAQLLVHPLTNTATTIISPAHLETFLREAGRTVVYVDFTANPATSVDSPPDLAQFADAAQPYGSVLQNAGDVAGGPRAMALLAPLDAGKKQEGHKSKPVVVSVPRGDDVDGITQRIMAEVCSALSASGAAADDAVLRKLHAQIELELNALRNAAYARGCTATKGHIVAYLQGTH